MSSVVARRIKATPARSASEAWAMIVNLVAPNTGAARTELESIAGIASSLISDEAFKDAPAVMRGKGPRVRFYCLYGEDAITGDDASESALATVPTDEDWKMSLPCSPDDLTWVQSALKAKSTRVTARDLNDSVSDDDEETSSASSKAVAINKEAFLRA
jgi:hypothetical protein